MNSKSKGPENSRGLRSSSIRLLDRDPVGHRWRHLRKVGYQNAVLIRGLDLFVYDLSGQPDRPDELPDLTLSPQIRLTRDLVHQLPTSLNGQQVAGQIDVQVLLVDTGHLQPHHELFRVLGEIQHRIPLGGRGLERERWNEWLGQEPWGGEAIEEPLHFLPELPRHGGQLRNS